MNQSFNIIMQLKSKLLHKTKHRWDFSDRAAASKLTNDLSSF